MIDGPPDVVVETSGVPSAIQTALDLVKMTGRVASIGLSGGKETAIKFDTLVAKGVTIACDHAQAGNVTDAMRIINSGKYDIEKINNVHYPLKDLPRALEETAHPPERFIRVPWFSIDEVCQTGIQRRIDFFWRKIWMGMNLS